MSTLKYLSALAMSLTLPLAGCSTLLGDFEADPSAPGAAGGGSGGNGSGQQGRIFIMPADGLVTTEQGAKATFGIALTQEPTETVTVALASSDETEGMVSPSAVTFTKDNYAAPQMVQVIGVDDDDEDGPVAYTVRTFAANSNDAYYNNFDPIDPGVTNVDDDSAGFTVTPTQGLVTTESGGEATFTVALNRQPSAPVSIPLSSSNEGEGTVFPTSLTFTAENWMAPQVVTVTGTNDDAADGPQVYEAVTGLATSDDADYDLLEPDDVEVTNQDNDTAGVTLMPATGLLTFESGAMTSFGIMLNSPPESDVTIGLKSSNLAEGTVTPDSVTFTVDNWMAPQAVTVTGVDDDRADGNQPYLILTSVPNTEDAGYAALDPPDASVTNIDNDTPGLNVMPLMGLTTSETGDSATFTVALASRPSGKVLLDVKSNRETEGVAAPAQLEFTEANWEAPQTVTVTGVDDEVADGLLPYLVAVVPNGATDDAVYDAAYKAVLAVDVSLNNIDDDSAGIDVRSTGDLLTAERGDATLFTVALTSRPKAEVSLVVKSSNTKEGVVSPERLLFTVDNWAARQTVTITGVNDNVADGKQPYRIEFEPAVSTDAGYRGLKPSNLSVANIDDDSAGITIMPANVTLTTGEWGGTATFQVRLNSEPKADVVIPLSSSNGAEGTVSPASLRFTPVNWNAPQTVTAKGVEDDGSADGPQPYRIVLAPAQSDDGAYRIDANDVNATNLDNDTPGIRILNGQNLFTNEQGGTATFQIVLNSKPTANVRIPLSVSRPAEGTISPAAVTFTRDNWSAPQTVTLRGVNDDIADGDQTYRAQTSPAESDDSKYRGIDPFSPDVINRDDDTPGIIVAYSPTTGLTTHEKGTPVATFTVVLKSEPTADVTVPLRSSNTGEGTISPASLTFTAANWNAPRTVTVTGVDDRRADGAQPYTVHTDPATSTDPNYAGRNGPDVPVQNTDNDSPGITVSAVSGSTDETGQTATFTVVLNSEPGADVTVPLRSSEEREGQVSPTSVTFTKVNWAAPQRITVTGQDDAADDGPQPYRIEFLASTSADPQYRGLVAPDVELSNGDDDSAAINVSAASGDTGENGATATFTLRLNSQPSADVRIALRSSNEAEGELSVSSVTFTPADWASLKTITVTGVDDEVADGRQPYTIILDSAVSNDLGYRDLDAPDVALFNRDNDSPGFDVGPGGSTSEPSGAFTFTVALTSKPTANVDIALRSSDMSEGTVSPAMLTFTPLNWKAKQTVTVRGVNDNAVDGDVPYSIQLAATSTDAGYDEYPIANVAMTNEDDDSPGIVVSAAVGNTSEGGDSTSFTIVLRSEPGATVTIPLSISDATEGRIAPLTQVVFDATNWDMPQSVTVRGEDDDEADGPQSYAIRTDPAVSMDPNYSGLNANDVAVINDDDDNAGVVVSPVSGRTSEGGGKATFTIRLNSRPGEEVSIDISSSNTDEGTISPATVSFPIDDDWAKPQTVTITGVDDLVADGPQEYSIRLAKPVSQDTDYAALPGSSFTVTNDDNDSASIMVSSPSGTSTSEAAEWAPVTFSVSLTSAPTSEVTIELASSVPTEAVVTDPSNGRLVFNASNWRTARVVTVQGVDDAVVDGPQPYVLEIGPVSSSDAAYQVLNPADIPLQNLDDDVALPPEP